MEVPPATSGGGGGGSAAAGSAPPPRAAPAAPAPAAAATPDESHRAVRRHAAEAVLRDARPTSPAMTTKLSLIRNAALQGALAVGLTVALGVEASLTPDADAAQCRGSFSYWLWLVALRAWLYALTMAALAAKWDASGERAQGRQVYRLSVTRTLLIYVLVGLFAFGNVLVFTAGAPCSGTRTWRLALGVLVLLYAQLVLPLAVLLVLLLGLLLCMPLILRRMARHIPANQHAATEAQIDALPERRYRPGVLPPGAETACAICFADYEPGEALRILPCGGSHAFHKGCIDDWLRINANCPVCRGTVVERPPPPAATSAAVAPAAGPAAAAVTAEEGRGSLASSASSSARSPQGSGGSPSAVRLQRPPMRSVGRAQAPHPAAMFSSAGMPASSHPG